MKPTHCIILAAGKGTRMNSELPKVALEVGGEPMVSRVIRTAQSVCNGASYVVVGYQAKTVESLTQQFDVIYVEQAEQLGTGHAVIQVARHVPENDSSNTIILSGDSPLISAESLSKIIDIHHKTDAAATVLSTKVNEPGAYGRILRGSDGNISGIKEAKDCTEEECRIDEVNTGIYCVDTQLLFDTLKRLGTNNAQGEYYLTDVIHLLHQGGHCVTCYCTPNSDEVMGVNTPEELENANQLLANTTPPSIASCDIE